MAQYNKSQFKLVTVLISTYGIFFEMANSTASSLSTLSSLPALYRSFFKPTKISGSVSFLYKNISFPKILLNIRILHSQDYFFCTLRFVFALFFQNELKQHFQKFFCYLCQNITVKRLRFHRKMTLYF